MSKPFAFLFVILTLGQLGHSAFPVTRWGIIAAGKITNDFIKSLKNLPISEHRVDAIASRELYRAQDYARKYNISRAYGSYAQLASDPGIDVVYIGTINPYHLPVAKMMLNAGKAVLCEKPLTMNKKQAQELIDLARRRNLFLMEALWSRFLPPYEFAYQQIANGAIGEVKHVDSRFTVPIGNVPRMARKELGASCTLDIGVYAVNTILMAFNNTRPTKISAVGVLNGEGVDIATNAAFLFPGGRTGSISVNVFASAPSETIIAGTKGYIRFAAPLNSPETVIVNGNEYRFNLKDGTSGYNWENNSGLRFQAIEVRKRLLGKDIESPRMSHAHSLLLAEIEDELRRQVGNRFSVD